MMMSRRNAIALMAAPLGAQAPRTKPELILFSKHAAQLSYAELGRVPKQMGFDGIDLTTRPKGHVLPENVVRDLPRAVEAIRAGGLSVPMITTDVKTASDPAAGPTIETAGKLKIPYWKIGYTRYKGGLGVEQILAATKAETAKLAAMSAKHGVTAGFHNHSGDYVGSPVWDTREMIRELPEKAIGYYFDPAHATIEGGLGGFSISLDIVLPRLKMAAVKDFYWQKDKDGKWKTVWCPLGQGMVDWKKFFTRLAEAKFAGPISVHVEYPTKDELQSMADDLATLKKLMAS